VRRRSLPHWRSRHQLASPCGDRRRCTRREPFWRCGSSHRPSHGGSRGPFCQAWPI
jgi:hypothetical protein